MPAARLLRVSLGFALAAIAVTAPAIDARADWAPIHDYRGAVPVLVYHGIHENADPHQDIYAVSPSEFARQLAMLSAAGFKTISIAQYARFAAGDVTQLPSRPILITFDDSRLDSYTGADPLLARYGMRATMFVITGDAGGPAPGSLGWGQLAAMSASGRWDVQFHANEGHVLIPTRPRASGPYYANLIYRNGRRETFTDFKRRVTSDILAGRAMLAARIPGYLPLAFAVPYSNYGQQSTNYAPIPAWERGWLEHTFQVLFVQDERTYNLPGNPIGQRYGVHNSTKAETLYRWLVGALPAGAETAPRPRRPSVRKVRRGRRSVVILFRVRGGASLKVSRRRAGHRRKVQLPVSARGRLRDRRLRPGRVYVYRAVAVNSDGLRSRPLRLRVRTRR